MKTIGLLGGMSWESTALYYQKINQATKEALGGLHSARIAMVSVDFAEIERLQHEGNWQACAEILGKHAREVESAGADFLLICTNTMHKVASEVGASINIPLLHIADATAGRIHSAGFQKVGLLGTRFTMEEDFYKGRLEDTGLSVVVPEDRDMATVHRVIYEELCLGTIREVSRREFVEVVAKMVDLGAQCVIAGCTEITMLIGPQDVDVPLFDTTAIHAEEAVTMVLP